MHRLRLKSHVVFHLVPEETCTTIRNGKEARIGRHTLVNGWPFSHTSRARTLGLCGGVRILVSDNLEGEARLAVVGKQEPVQVEGKVVRHKNRKKHGLPSFTIRSLRRRCDRLGRGANPVSANPGLSR